MPRLSQESKNAFTVSTLSETQLELRDKFHALAIFRWLEWVLSKKSLWIWSLLKVRDIFVMLLNIIYIFCLFHSKIINWRENYLLLYILDLYFYICYMFLIFTIKKNEKKYINMFEIQTRECQLISKIEFECSLSSSNHFKKHWQCSTYLQKIIKTNRYWLVSFITTQVSCCSTCNYCFI